MAGSCHNPFPPHNQKAGRVIAPSLFSLAFVDRGIDWPADYEGGHIRNHQPRRSHDLRFQQ